MWEWTHETVDTPVTVGSGGDLVGETLTRLAAAGWTIVSVARAGTSGRFDIIAKRQRA